MAFRTVGRWLVAWGILVMPAFGARGATIYEADWASGTINAFQPDGSRATFAAGLSNPSALAFDTAGNLYEADEGSGNVYRFTSAGVRSTFASGLGQPYGLAIDRSTGNVFVSDVSAGNGGRVVKVSPGGGQSVLASGFLFPLGLALDTAGNLFVADFSRIDKVTPTGAVSTFAGASSGAGMLAFDGSGNLFLTDDQRDVWWYTPSGVASLFGTVPGRSGAIAFEPNGNLLVGDRGQTEIGAGALYEFTPSGMRSTFATGLNDPQAGLIVAPLPKASALLPVVLVGLVVADRAARRARRQQSVPRG